MKEHKFDFNSFIGGWYIPKKICNDLIKLFNFHKDSNNVYKGEISKDEKLISNKSIKDSFELPIDSNLKEDVIKDYRNELQKVLELYLKKYPKCNEVNHFNIISTYNIQYYKPGGGYKIWHNERSNKFYGNRHLVFMTYLNDVEDGGTMFYHQKITCPAKKGLTLIWPTDWTHTHKGQISKKHEKYIITGWYNFI
jgi:hypothetical protein